ncbi:putative zinc-type alcohol dehydrogenase-like protein PB24D3.08c [Lentithecium fluviatile CBS 122367]|uniref:Putative zinc-type alcohol dehydrogenase-like protein PB24D3.08c n=1 Tax=Lentithecium fluviatile CBS 122367 TaxID=1168545 RepID=A0A6G1IXG8_9PLEO|nr:putative zinc-type alcohol dehydrogenase-like protein PB24D3.08c [Lentithecium fluviatile CBS 122367]
MVANKGLIFKKVPEAFPVIGEHLDVETREFDIDTEPPEGGLTVKNLFLSFDPYQRGCMREPDNYTYQPPFTPGQPIISGAVSKVLKSAVTGFEPGDVVWGMLGSEEYSVVPPFLMSTVRKVENPLGLDLILFTGALGVCGLSAWASLYEIGKPKRGQTIFVSAASGGVGQIVGQLAKMEGLRVIGSVGSDEKLNFILEELGFDAGFNYKKEGVEAALERLAPEGLDIYYDNVGGETLDVALSHMKDFGRIVSCGMVSQYNLPQPLKYGLQRGMNIFLKRLTIQGFIISDPQFVGPHVGDFFPKMSVWLKEGRIKTKESVTVGMENAATSYLGMFRGDNFGKTVLQVADLEG